MTKLAATRTDRPRGRRFEPGWPENVFKKQGEELSTSCEVLLGWNGDSNRGLEAARSEDRKEELSTPCEILLGQNGDSNLNSIDRGRQPRNDDTKTKEIKQQKQASRPAGKDIRLRRRRGLNLGPGLTEINVVTVYLRLYDVLSEK